MDAVELTMLFVNYKNTADALAALEAQITQAVLELEASQKIAGVKATYYQPSLETDWEAACKCAGVIDELVEKFTVTKKTVSWAKVAGIALVDGEGFQTEKPARVVVKLD